MQYTTKRSTKNMYGNVFSLIYCLNSICIMSIYVINSTICRLHYCDNTVYNNYYVNYKQTRKTMQCEPKRWFYY